jgi:hypothetical protein
MRIDHFPLHQDVPTWAAWDTLLPPRAPWTGRTLGAGPMRWVGSALGTVSDGGEYVRRPTDVLTPSTETDETQRQPRRARPRGDGSARFPPRKRCGLGRDRPSWRGSSRLPGAWAPRSLPRPRWRLPNQPCGPVASAAAACRMQRAATTVVSARSVRRRRSSSQSGKWRPRAQLGDRHLQGPGPGVEVPMT